MVPPPERPVPEVTLICVLPWTALLIVDPYTTAKLVEPPRLTVAPPDSPLPAVIPIVLFCNAALASVVVAAVVKRPWASTVKVGTPVVEP
jgi:hypothetical protein